MTRLILLYALLRVTDLITYFIIYILWNHLRNCKFLMHSLQSTKTSLFHGSLS